MVFGKWQWADGGSRAVSGLVSLEPGLGDTAAACSLDTGLLPLGRRSPAARGSWGAVPTHCLCQAPSPLSTQYVI